MWNIYQSNDQSVNVKVKEKSEKVGLKLKIQKAVSDFIFGGSKISADGDCSQEIKRCLLLGRKVMTNLDSIYLKAETLLG